MDIQWHGQAGRFVTATLSHDFLGVRPSQTRPAIGWCELGTVESRLNLCESQSIGSFAFGGWECCPEVWKTRKSEQGAMGGLRKEQIHKQLCSKCFDVGRMRPGRENYRRMSGKGEGLARAVHRHHRPSLFERGNNGNGCIVG